MVDFVEKCILTRIHTVPTGRGLLLDADPGLSAAADSCGLVLGYNQISLQENDRCRFHLSRVGFAGRRLL